MQTYFISARYVLHDAKGLVFTRDFEEILTILFFRILPLTVFSVRLVVLLILWGCVLEPMGFEQSFQRDRHRSQVIETLEVFVVMGPQKRGIMLPWQEKG